VNTRHVGALAALLATIGLCSGNDGAWGQNGPVIVSQDGYTIQVDRGDGLGPQILTGGQFASLSLDQRQVAFSRDDGLYTIGVDGQDLRKVLDNQAFDQLLGWTSYRQAGWPAWTPSGQSLVFTWYGPFAYDLAFVDADGSNPRLHGIAGIAGVIANRSWPSPFSLDGRSLLMNPAESTGLYLVTLQAPTGVELTRKAEAGSWSPDGLWVAYVWERAWLDEAGLERGGLEVVSVDGVARLDLAYAARRETDQSFEPVGLVTWSPDGKEVVVQNSADGQLYAVAVDGTGVRPVATHFAPFTYPVSAVGSTSWGMVKQSVQP
jgi:Tol biopolymer transport system component